MKRDDDFAVRRKHLANLTDVELHARFWELAEQLVNPLLELGHKHTTPSIERSVLLRMGFSSLEAKAIVEGVMDRGLMGKGAGHIVFRLAQHRNLDIREAGLALMEGQCWNDVVNLFKGTGQ